MKRIITLALILIISSCSFLDSKKSQTTEFAVDTIADGPNISEFSVEQQKIATMDIHDELADQSLPLVLDEKNSEVLASDMSESQFNDVKPDDDISGPTLASVDIKPEDMSKQKEIYQVQQGDTLMLIAFKIYGDYRKWKEIHELNAEQLKSKLSQGMKLSYYVVDRSHHWKPDGTAYLVKKGDTLQSISMEKYGTTRKWKRIYANNRPVIRDPNSIFAGFTIYYKNLRDLASKTR